MLQLSDDDALCYKNIKKWIETQQGIVRAAGLVERSRTRDISQKEEIKNERANGIKDISHQCKDI